ncbi:hypothetical protein QUR06_000259 [Escherichia coli]|nr:hypothetical protein [Escherichia coli]
MDVKGRKTLLDILNKSKKGEPVEQILAQVKHAQAKAEDARAQNVNRFNKSYLYYACQLPANTIQDGLEDEVTTKDYVEPVLFNAVKAALPQLLDSFTEDESLAVSFRSRGYRKNPAIEELINYNLNKIFLRDQDGYEILEGLFRTTLISGDSFAKVFVDEITHRETATVTDWIDIRDLLAELAEGWTLELPKNFADKSGSNKGFEWKEEKSKEQDPNTGESVTVPVLLIRGKIPLKNVEKKVIVEEVEPQDVWVSTDYGNDFSKCRYLAHRIKTTVGEAELRGFDPDKLANAPDESTDTDQLPEMFFSMNQVDYNNPGFTVGSTRETSIDPKERPIILMEHYIYSSLPTKNKETRLYQVVTTGDEVLSIQEVKRIPFVHGQCEPVQGQFFGRSFFDAAKPFQDAISLAQRMQQEIAKKTTWPQYIAVKGAYNRESLMNNRPGSVIEVMQQGAVDRFKPLELSQTFLAAHENLKASREETLTQPVSITNDNGAVSQISTQTAYLSIFQESQKGMILTKNISRTLVQPLYKLIYEIVKDENFTLFAPDGSTVEGAELPNVYDLIVDPSTTHDDFAQNMQLNNVASFVLQASQLNSPVITPQNIYEISKDMLEKFDIDSSKYLSDPSQNQDPQAAHEQAEMQALNSEMAKVQLQAAIVDVRKKAAEIYKLEQEAEELVRDGHSKRLKDKADSMAKVQKIIADAQAQSESTRVKAQEVAVKDKAVNYETILATTKHVSDITAPQINGVK